MKIEKRHKKSSPLWGITFILLLVALITGCIIILKGESHDGGVTMRTDTGEQKDLTNNDAVITEARKLPEKLNFQDLAESWNERSSGRTSVYIYDLDYNIPIAKVNENNTYGTASLYKLFPVYEGYRRVERGEWNGDDILTGSRTIKQCLDAAIRSSDSACGEALWAKINRYTLDEIIVNDYKITNSKISSLSSNPVDIAKMLKLYYEHPDFSDGTYQTILDSMLNQPPVNNGNCAGACVWRQGLPSGLENENIKVYDKVGWDYGNGYWNIYHDAAIVTAGDHHLIVVVMTSGINSFSEITSFGRQLRSELEK